MPQVEVGQEGHHFFMCSGCLQSLCVSVTGPFHMPLGYCPSYSVSVAELRLFNCVLYILYYTMRKYRAKERVCCSCVLCRRLGVGSMAPAFSRTPRTRKSFLFVRVHASRGMDVQLCWVAESRVIIFLSLLVGLPFALHFVFHCLFPLSNSS